MRALALLAALGAAGCEGGVKTCGDFQEFDACEPESAPICAYCGVTCRCDVSAGRSVWTCEGPGCFDLHMPTDLSLPRDVASVD
jgi:hypothetical protein